MRRRRPLIATGLLLLALVGAPLALFGKPPLGSEYRAFLPPEAPSLSGAVSEDSRPISSSTPPDVAWTFKADRVVSQHDSKYVEASGDVTLTQGSNTLRADFARYYEASRWVFLSGNVRAVWEGDIMEAEEAEFDLDSKVGWFKRGKIYVAKPHLFVETEYLQKHKGDVYTFKNARVTRCSGPTPVWSLAAGEGEVEIDGRTRLWHSTFNVKDVPVAYVPYAVVPGMKRRQSGLLAPEIFRSKRLGFGTSLPYYWVINDEMDATVTQTWLSKRGYMPGLEFRHALNAKDKGLWRLDWLSDEQVDRKESDEDPRFRGDGLTRPNSNRWWWRSKYDSVLADSKWKTKLDVDLVSDQNYLREFGRGRQGYTFSRMEFIKRFGRDIAAADETKRTSEAMLSRSWDKGGVAAKLSYTQDLAYWNGNNDGDMNPTLQRMPEVSAYAYKDRLADTPVEYEGGVDYSYNWRQWGTKGHRLNAGPQVSLPLHGDVATFIPRAGMRHSMYATDRWQTTGTVTDFLGNSLGPAAAGDDFQSRTNTEAGFDLFSEFYRVFDMDSSPLSPTAANAGQSRWAKVKHSMVPRVEYSYMPTLTGQDRLPYYDERDRLRGRNISTVSFTNVLDRRRESVVMASDGRDNVPRLTTDYLDFVRLRLAQGYDYNEAERQDMLERYPRRPLTDFTAELTLQPEEWLSLTSRSRFSPYEYTVTEHEHFFRLQKKDLGAIFFGLNFLSPLDEYDRYRDRDMSLLRLGGEYYVTQNLILGVDYRYDLYRGSEADRSIDIIYRHECMDIMLSYDRNKGDDRLGVSVELFQF